MIFHNILVLYFIITLIYEDKERFCVAIGSRKLEFTEIGVKGRPYYHFAFNIQSNMFNEAKSWVKEKVYLILDQIPSSKHLKNV